MSVKIIDLRENTNLNIDFHHSRERSAKRKLDFGDESTMLQKKIFHENQENASGNQENIIRDAFNLYTKAMKEQAPKIVDDNQIYENRLLDHGVDIHNKNNIIGQGGFGRVLKLDPSVNNKTSEIALTLIAKLQSPYKSKNPEKSAELAQNELRILKILTEENAPHIVKQIDSFDASQKRYASIQEYGGQTIHDIYLSSQNPNKKLVTWIDLQRIGHQILIALNHLHTPNKNRNAIVHNDLKPRNIAEDAEGTIRVFDFGVAQELTEKSIRPGGTLIYQSPETFYTDGKDFSDAAQTSRDIWALACTLFELRTGEKLIKLPDGEIPNRSLEILYAIKSRLVFKEFPLPIYKCKQFIQNGSFIKSNLAPLPSYQTVIRSKTLGPKTEEFIDLLNLMLKWYPQSRSSAKELLKHPFFLSEADNLIQNVLAAQGMEEDDSDSNSQSESSSKGAIGYSSEYSSK